MIDTLFPSGMAQYLVGGSLIGLAVALLFVLTGRLGGISTFFSAIWSYCQSSPFFQQPAFLASRNWRLLFSIGLVAGGGLYTALGLPLAVTAIATWKLALGGVLVGFGARLGGGCTSGHGICGMASLSGGSMVIVATFLISGIATASLLLHLGI